MYHHPFCSLPFILLFSPLSSLSSFISIESFLASFSSFPQFLSPPSFSIIIKLFCSSPLRHLLYTLSSPLSSVLSFFISTECCHPSSSFLTAVFFFLSLPSSFPTMLTYLHFLFLFRFVIFSTHTLSSSTLFCTHSSILDPLLNTLFHSLSSFILCSPPPHPILLYLPIFIFYFFFLSVIPSVLIPLPVLPSSFLSQARCVSPLRPSVRRSSHPSVSPSFPPSVRLSVRCIRQYLRNLSSSCPRSVPFLSPSCPLPSSPLPLLSPPPSVPLPSPRL